MASSADLESTGSTALLLERLTQAMHGLRRYVHKHMPNKADAEDIVQESLARTLHRAGETHLHQPDHYALRIARNLMADHARQSDSADHGEVEDLIACNAPLPDEQMQQRQRLAIVTAALETMPPLRREVFRRRRLEGQSREEIAQALGLQPEAVKKHITRAMAQLARALEKAE
jgi:RNA polymerase sigma factor (sigma-70 family)